MKLITFITLLLLGTSSWAAATKNIAGYVGETTGGAAFAFNKLGQKRKLAAKAPVFEGETLITSKTAKSSVIFTDGTLIELNPSTQFRVEEFRYGKEEEKPSAVFRMLKGGFRFISGLVNKKGGNLSFKTPTATIGIRGSAGGFSLNDKGEMTVEVYEGEFEWTSVQSKALTKFRAGDKIISSKKGTTTEKLTKEQLVRNLTSLKARQKTIDGYRANNNLSAFGEQLDKEKLFENQIEKAEKLLKQFNTVAPVRTGGGSEISTKVNTATPSMYP